MEKYNKVNSEIGREEKNHSKRYNLVVKKEYKKMLKASKKAKNKFCTDLNLLNIQSINKRLKNR